MIPGAKSSTQSLANAKADALAPLSAETMEKAREVYSRLIAPEVHHLW